ncbi:Tetratricopeptide repeat protein [Sulfidibacter corallicola]|uniref:Tetratricopeptide repeat protein n=1 Tax=Sulfidibacter corallicola TaxID=2818388 RepID=A0A8A4TRB5_SULCO|nr:tetratricopeptide repeat protein [Sulfidibacter corallicola]QTD51724.1 tetratricopeptide repeat protein [Sulfidibacter corallicola]
MFPFFSIILLLTSISQEQEMNQEPIKSEQKLEQKDQVEIHKEIPNPSKTELPNLEERLAKLEETSRDSTAKKIREWSAFFLGSLATILSLCSFWISKRERKRNRLSQANQHLEKAWDHLGSPQNTPEILIDNVPAVRLNLKEAEKEINQALELAPKLPLVYIRRGDFYRSQGNEDKALNEYEKALALDPKLAQAYRKMGNIHHAKGNDEAALIDFSKAIEMDQSDYLSYYNRGIIYKFQQKFPEAILDFDQCIKQNPSFAAAWVNRGVVFKDQGDLDQAIADYTEALERDPSDDQVFFNRALAYKEKGKLYSAISDLRHSIGLRPDYQDAYYSRALIWKQMGHLDMAFADYVQFIELRNVVPPEDHQAVLEKLDQALRKNPGDIGALFNRALVLFKEKNLEKAVRDLEVCIRVITGESSATPERKSINPEKKTGQPIMGAEEADVSNSPTSVLKPGTLLGKKEFLPRTEVVFEIQNIPGPPDPCQPDRTTDLSERAAKGFSFRANELDRPLNMLIAVPNSKAHSFIDPQQVKQDIAKAWSCTPIAIELMEPACLNRLAARLREGEKIDILHVTAHGRYWPPTGMGYLFFEDGKGGVDAVDSLRFSKALTLPTCKRPDLVTLVACDSGRLSKQGVFFTRSVALELEKRGYPAIVGMQAAISPANAFAFSAAFYEKLNLGFHPEEALNEASQTIAKRDPHSLDWASPVLLGHRRSGSFFPRC